MKAPFRWNLFLTALLLAAGGGCVNSQSNEGRALQATSNDSTPPQPYMRVVGADSNVVELQIAVRKFSPARGSGPVVWLTGASHLGDSNYFHALQTHLDAQALVLFEGVSERHKQAKVKAANASATTKIEADPQKPAETAGLQHTLAESLGLEFQLEAINYDRPNFRNSDLSIEQIQRLMQQGRKDTGGGGDNEFTQLLQIMDETSFMGALAKLVVTFLGSSPKLQALTRLVLIETLGEIRGDMAEMKGLPPDMQRLVKVLIEARNQNVVDDLKGELKTKSPPKSIAVFYGAGHMDDMEKRLRTELKYRPAGQLWLTAFSVNLQKSGVTESERDMIHSFVKWQLEAMAL